MLGFLKKALNTLHEQFFEEKTKQLNLFVTGVGNVGERFLAQIQQQREFLKENLKLNIKVIGIANSRKMFFDNDGIDLENWKKIIVKSIKHLKPKGKIIFSSINRTILSKIFAIFIAEKDGEEPIWWFGGGFDLTPYYGFIEDAKHWHEMSKTACDGFGNDTYLKYKKWCDEYFYLKHRQEPRGIGGIFYDDLNEWGFESCFLFMQSVGENFLKAYLPIVERRRDITYSKKERDFQLYRRSRYAEFNLLYDRGTLFGLQSGGRIESILMSMPPLARWEYNWQPAAGSKEAELYDVFLKPKDWLAE